MGSALYTLDCLIGTIFGVIECCEIVTLRGTIEYILVIVKFICSKFGLDIEKEFPEQLLDMRFGLESLCFRWALDLLRITVKTVHPERADLKERTVYMITHASFLDMMISRAYGRKNMYYIGKHELGKIPFLGISLISTGHVLIDRKNLKDAIAGLDHAGERVKHENKSIVIAPEGTRRRAPSRDDGEHLLPFKKGGFHIAKKAEAEIMPITFQGLHRLTKGFLARPGTVRMTFGERISAKEVERLTVDEMMVKVRRDMINQMEPMPNSEIFKTEKSRLPWLVFIAVHVGLYMLIRWLF